MAQWSQSRTQQYWEGDLLPAFYRWVNWNIENYMKFKIFWLRDSKDFKTITE